MEDFTTLPTKNGYYWLKHTNCPPEIVFVAFDYVFRRKPVTRVLAKFWSANLSEIPTDSLWSKEIVSPWP